MLERITLTAAISLVCCLPAGADWVELKGGQSLRGIDAKKRGQVYTLTLESGLDIALAASLVTGVKKSPPGETVDFRGRQVSLREKIRTLKQEDQKKEKDAIRDIEKWARGGKGAEAGRAAVASLAAQDRQRYLAAALTKSQVSAARILSAKEIAGLGGSAVLPRLAHAAVTDIKKDVREACLESIQGLQSPEAGDAFLPYLRNSSRAVRVHAAEALEVIPTERAVPVIIDALTRSWSNFGRSFFVQGTTHSYIRDYNLVSGGTGYSIMEIADPEVATTTDGVVLDVDVKKVEITTYVRALRKLTGLDLGADARPWLDWWKTAR
jgi:hypothetical protein